MHDQGIQLPPFDFGFSSELPRQRSTEALQYERLFTAYPLYFYQLFEEEENLFFQYLKKMPTVEELASRETPRSIRSHSPSIIGCWHQVISQEEDKEERARIPRELFAPLVERFMECDYDPLTPETVRDYFGDIDLDFLCYITAQGVKKRMFQK